MPEKLSLPPVRMRYPSALLDMHDLMEPLLAILAVIVPLGLAYVILLLQSRKSASGCRKPSATPRDALLQKKTDLFRTEQ